MFQKIYTSMTSPLTGSEFSVYFFGFLAIFFFFAIIIPQNYIDLQN